MLLGVADLEMDVLPELEVVCVHVEVVHDERVVHVVWEVSWNGEVAEAHHLLGGVDDDRAIDAGSVWLWVLLQREIHCNTVYCTTRALVVQNSGTVTNSPKPGGSGPLNYTKICLPQLHYDSLKYFKPYIWQRGWREALCQC